MDLLQGFAPQKKIALATLGYAEGYIPFEEYDTLLKEYSEIYPEVLLFALSNLTTNDPLLHRLIRLTGLNFNNNAWTEKIREYLASRGKTEALSIIDSYIKLGN